MSQWCITNKIPERSMIYSRCEIHIEQLCDNFPKTVESVRCVRQTLCSFGLPRFWVTNQEPILHIKFVSRVTPINSQTAVEQLSGRIFKLSTDFMQFHFCKHSSFWFGISFPVTTLSFIYIQVLLVRCIRILTKSAYHHHACLSISPCVLSCLPLDGFS